MFQAERYALQSCNSKRVEMSHSSWLVYGDDESLEPKHFVKCLADDQMIWLELLRYDILENGKKIVISYLLMEHVHQPSRGIFSFLHILLPWLGTPTLIPLFWLQIPVIHLSRLISELKCFLRPSYSHHWAPQLWVSTVIRQSIKYTSPYIYFLYILLGQRPCFGCPCILSIWQFTFVSLFNGYFCLCRHYEVLIITTVMVNTECFLF